MRTCLVSRPVRMGGQFGAKPVLRTALHSTRLVAEPWRRALANERNKRAGWTLVDVIPCNAPSQSLSQSKKGAGPSDLARHASHRPPIVVTSGRRHVRASSAASVVRRVPTGNPPLPLKSMLRYDVTDLTCDLIRRAGGKQASMRQPTPLLLLLSSDLRRTGPQCEQCSGAQNES